jgi:nucleotide-binding universal stress UspA family protein
VRLLQLRTVIVAHDLTTTSDAALETAQMLAADAGASLHLATVAPPNTGMMAQRGRRAEFIDEMAVAANRAKVTTPYTPHVLEGDPAEAIASLADRISADVIITGRRLPRNGVPMDRPVGGTAYAIITRSRVPCLVVTTALALPLHRVVVAIDCSEASRGALLAGLSWSSALRPRAGGEAPILTALHVHDHERESEARAHQKRTVDHELDLLRRNAGDWAGVEVSGITRPGKDPVQAIADLASELRVDLVVLGTRGIGAAADGTLGSVSAAVIGKVRAPVLLVPPAVWRNFAKEIEYLV